MNLRISGKHMDIGDAFRTRIDDRVGEAIGKYFDGGFSGHVTVDQIGVALFGRLHDPAGFRRFACRRPAMPRIRRLPSRRLPIASKPGFGATSAG